MKTRITELSCKEVINLCDGTRYGFVNDVEVDCSCGKIISIIVYVKDKDSSLFSKKHDIVIPWEAIKRIGEDLILVDFSVEFLFENKKRSIFSK